ncbi:MAG: formylglycine-generating enzyme family protein [Elusimicrobiota bacterium]
MKSSRIGVVAAGLLCLAAGHAGSSGGTVEFGSDVEEFIRAARASKVPDASWMVPVWEVGENDSQAGKPGVPVEWVSFNRGKFTMGSDDDGKSFTTAKPTHEVTIEAFDMSKTLVTTEQYKECVIQLRCTEPDTGSYCNWEQEGRQRHPINCVDWDQANQYAEFQGARLPSESEWEYAAMSAGKRRKYPWGDGDANCDNAVMYGCVRGVGTMPVGSKPAGDTIEGLSDMVGNVWQWVGDMWHDSYAGAPTDGGAWQDEDTGSGPRRRVIRGGSFYSKDANFLRVEYRGRSGAWLRSPLTGFRLARSSR